MLRASARPRQAPQPDSGDSSIPREATLEAALSLARKALAEVSGTDPTDAVAACSAKVLCSRSKFVGCRGPCNAPARRGHRLRAGGAPSSARPPSGVGVAASSAGAAAPLRAGRRCTRAAGHRWRSAATAPAGLFGCLRDGVERLLPCLVVGRPCGSVCNPRDPVGSLTYRVDRRGMTHQTSAQVCGDQGACLRVRGGAAWRRTLQSNRGFTCAEHGLHWLLYG